MKQFRIYLALLCTLLLAVGCSKDMETETTRPTDAASLIKIGDFPTFDQGADTRATGTPDPGKAQWADGDKVLLKLSKTDSYDRTFIFCYTLTYDGANAQWNSDTSMDRVIDNNELDHMNVTAHYAPAYEWNARNEPALKSDKTAGTDEYLTYTATNVHLRDGINIDFSGTRPYSRLRVAAAVGATVQFTPSNGTFTPSGSESALADATTLSAKADAKGNAFFYGTWTAGSEFTFFTTAPSKMGEVKKTITAAATAGESYAVDAQLMDVASMSMSIDTRKNTSNFSDATFILPFQGTISGYSLFVNWGDGKISAFNDGTALDQNNMTHTYPQAGEFTITISSTQTDAAQQQMLVFNFATYSQNANTSKFTSLNSPLLNMGVTSFAYVFKNCTNLTTISSGLFDNNTEVTDFQGCFQESGLTAIPTGLFDNNPLVTNFNECFSRCQSLAKIPDGLFDKNTQVTDFSGCFKTCTLLTAIPEGLFDKNTQVTDFSGCFQTCSGLTAIPEGLFEKNTQVTNFYNCFLSCSAVVLNPNIFCNEATDRETRFAGIDVNFTSCFRYCGRDLNPGTGGTAPALWSYKYTQTPASRWCFGNVTNVTNVGDIPANWKE